MSAPSTGFTDANGQSCTADDEVEHEDTGRRAFLAGVRPDGDAEVYWLNSGECAVIKCHRLSRVPAGSLTPHTAWHPSFGYSSGEEG